MAADAPVVTSRNLRQALQLLDRIEHSLQKTGLSNLLDDPGKMSAEDLTRMLDDMDFTGITLGGERETPETAAELATLAPELSPTRDAELHVEVSTDSMSAEAVITPPVGDGHTPDIDELLAILMSRYKITHGIDRDAVVRLLEAGRMAPARAVIAAGVAPVAGRAETWELVASGETRNARERDRVDYREMAAQKAVAAEELLARRVPAVPGRVGTNVRGQVIPTPTLPRGQTLGAGTGTERRDNGIYAVIAGQLRCERGIITVVPQRCIDGDIDFSTGNVDFPGSVFIKGSVLDGFSVKAGGDIEVGGSISSAHVDAKGSVLVRGGIFGNGKGMVRAGRVLEAKFIENAQVEAHDAVRVRKAILHSNVDTLGLVEVTGEPGAVVGGLLHTGAGLRCRTLGSVAGTQTRVSFGENHLVFRKLEAIDKMVAFLRARVREVEMSLAPFNRQRAGPFRQRAGPFRQRAGPLTMGAGNLTAEEGAVLKKMIELRTKLLSDLRRLTTSRVTVLADAERAPEGDVRVRDEVYAGVILSSRGVERSITERHVHARFRLTDDRIEVCIYE